jgi:threonine/homoserine/homoserine lactone efflux protein
MATTPISLEKHIFLTYFSLRIGIAIMALAFPLVLLLGGIVIGVKWQDSMSAYYHASSADSSMRDWFVGILFGVAAFLILYRGYRPLENWLLNIGGVFAVGVAIFPMSWECTSNCKWSPHGFCAVAFFLCLAAVCLFCSRDTLQLIKDPTRRKRYQGVYSVLGVMMVALPLAAWVVTTVFTPSKVVFCIESAGIVAFAAYWLTKSKELEESQLDRKVMKGMIKHIPAAPLNPLAHISEIGEASPLPGEGAVQ